MTDFKCQKNNRGLMYARIQDFKIEGAQKKMCMQRIIIPSGKREVPYSAGIESSLRGPGSSRV